MAGSGLDHAPIGGGTTDSIASSRIRGSHHVRPAPIRPGIIISFTITTALASGVEARSE
jgi:hypothetical protein